MGQKKVGKTLGLVCQAIKSIQIQYDWFFDRGCIRTVLWWYRYCRKRWCFRRSRMASFWQPRCFCWLQTGPSQNIIIRGNASTECEVADCSRSRRIAASECWDSWITGRRNPVYTAAQMGRLWCASHINWSDLKHTISVISTLPLTNEVVT